MTEPLTSPPDPPPPVAPAPIPPRAPVVVARNSRAHRGLWMVLTPVLIVLVLAVSAAGWVRSPYVRLAPGSARSVGDLIEVPKDKAHRDPGEILFLTVSVSRSSIPYLQAVRSWLDPDSDVFPRKVIYGDESREESQQQNLQMMDNSKLVAGAVALRKLGYPVKVTGTGVQIGSIAPDVPAAEVLHVGDVVVSANGKRTGIDRDLIAAIDGKKPGDRVELTVERGGHADQREKLSVTLAPRPQDPSAPMLGVTIATRGLNYKLPFTIKVATGDVGGPSAGLAFTLAILDRLTPGSLTGGLPVAVTGEISPDGQVLEVGGVGQKAVAARSKGAKLMIVPQAEVAEARKHAGSLHVVGVRTLDDALKALDQLGGNALALGRPGAATSGT